MLLKLFRIIIHFFSALMPKALTKNMLTCQEVAFILANTKNIEGPEFKKLRMHLFLCEPCANYRQQLLKMSKATDELGNLELNSDQLEKIKAHQERLFKNLKK